uniref:Peroxisomal membrane protein PEX14-like KPWE domain-containing protein n=1 Tax=Otus sunia TaxID=257818 RepID=A0A8C8BIZ3_9STRI
ADWAPPPPPPAPSFAEVLRLVRSGREPPGVRRPLASPTGDSPTASRLLRPTKPWESRPGPTGRLLAASTSGRDKRAKKTPKQPLRATPRRTLGSAMPNTPRSGLAWSLAVKAVWLGGVELCVFFTSFKGYILK